MTRGAIHESWEPMLVKHMGKRRASVAMRRVSCDAARCDGMSEWGGVNPCAYCDAREWVACAESAASWNTMREARGE